MIPKTAGTQPIATCFEMLGEPVPATYARSVMRVGQATGRQQLPRQRKCGRS